MVETSALNLTRKMIRDHLLEGSMTAGEEIRLGVDQVLLQDGVSTLTMQALEAMDLDRIKVETAVQYVDHNIFHGDFRNGDDHIYLRTACQRFGVWYSGPGNGVCHVLHMERFGVPGKLLVGSDSHTQGAGSLGMLAIGAGSVEVATVMAGEPFIVRMPQVWGVKLVGELPQWVSAQDVILEMLRRHSVKGGTGRIIEYYGPGVETLSAMDRHVICNKGAELGATSSVFPSDGQTRAFLADQGRGQDWRELSADVGAKYDVYEEIDLSSLEPLIATPSSPDNVVPVRQVAGEPVYQSYLGSCSNPGYRDFAMMAHMARGRKAAEGVSFDINPVSRQLMVNLSKDGLLEDLIRAGGRIHQTGCNGCMGQGQSPATGGNSLRTTPRNFPGRSGTKDDRVFLCSPETATASALMGRITDPRDLGIPYPTIEAPASPAIVDDVYLPPLPPAEAKAVAIVRGPGLGTIPVMEAPADTMEVPVILKLGDDISTDDLAPGGAKGMPFRSNVQKLSDLSLTRIDETYPTRAAATPEGHALVGGGNYGQGSSREHASLCPRHLGLRLVLAKGFARIHWQNLINAAIIPVTFADEADYDRIEQGDRLILSGLHQAIRQGRDLTIAIAGKGTVIPVHHALSQRQVEILFAGGLINWLKSRAL
jgi:aconitate hydratase